MSTFLIFIIKQKELFDVKKEFQLEHDHINYLKKTRESIEEESKNQIEKLKTELSESLRTISTAETRAAIAEVFAYYYYLHLLILICFLVSILL